MKKIFLAALLITSLLAAQEKNKLTVDEKSGKPMLLGLCDRTAFADTTFSWWFNSEYDNYTPDSSSVVSLQEKLKNVKITIVMGSWCSDSKREVPRFYKILDLLKYDQSALKLFCVNREKSTLGNEIVNMDIKLVPTFIFYRNDSEIGRIIESPKETLEKDLLEIVSAIR